MPTTEKFVTVALVSPGELGDAFEKIPPHITLCPPFRADPGRLDEYHDRMRAVMEENPTGIQVVDSEPRMYGDTAQIPVEKTWVPLLGGGFPIHLGAFIGAQAIGGSPDESYALHRWSPHISRVEGFAVPPVPFSLHEVYLLWYRSDGLKRIIGVYASDYSHILEYKEW